MPDELARLTSALGCPARPSSDFDLNPGIVLPEGRPLRAAAVLVAVTMQGRLILTKRASHLLHHPGQIAFPGGKVDPGDVDPEAAALREAREEVGLPETAVQVLGRLASHETVTGFQITPILGIVRQAFRPVPEAGEVEEVFSVPLSYVLDPTRYRVERRRWRGEWRCFYAVPYGPYYIWGATACILRGLADRVAG